MKVEDLAWLPGADLIQEGLRDLADDRESIPALLVRIGRPRLERLGLDLPVEALSRAGHEELPEHRLYRLLAETDPDSAHSVDAERMLSSSRRNPP